MRQFVRKRFAKSTDKHYELEILQNKALDLRNYMLFSKFLRFPERRDILVGIKFMR